MRHRHDLSTCRANGLRKAGFSLSSSLAGCRRLVERAKANLCDRFAFFGLTESYAASKRLFCHTFGLPDHYAEGEERFNLDFPDRFCGW